MDSERDKEIEKEWKSDRERGKIKEGRKAGEGKCGWLYFYFYIIFLKVTFHLQ